MRMQTQTPRQLDESSMLAHIAQCYETAEFQAAKGNRALFDWWCNRGDAYSAQLAVYRDVQARATHRTSAATPNDVALSRRRERNGNLVLQGKQVKSPARRLEGGRTGASVDRVRTCVGEIRKAIRAPHRP